MKKISHLKTKEVITLPNFITALNLLFGILSMYFSINNQFFYASLMMLLCLITDFADGKTARLLKMKTKFGKQIDSLTDFVSFGVSPSVFTYFYFSQISTDSAFLLIAIFFFLLTGMSRLADYNIHTPKHGFVGLPITMNAIFFPLIYAFNTPPLAMPFILIILGFAMISKLKVRRI